MNATNSKQNGGLILDKMELLPLLSEPGTVGLAFALRGPGQAENVDLSVLRVYRNGDGLRGDERTVSYKKGAAGPLHYPAREKEAFQFRFLDQLVEDQFFFGFYAKEKFDLLFRNGWDEVFIGGGKKTFPNTDYVEKETWFTLTIYLRRKLRSIFLDNGQLVEPVSRKELPKPYLLRKSRLPGAGRITMDSLRAAEPEVFGGKRRVVSILLKREEPGVRGVVFEEKGRLFPVLFDEKQKIGSLSLNLDSTLKFLTPGVEEAPETYQLQEALELGAFPYADHLDPCPPRWYWTDAESSLEEAVAAALEG